MFTDYRSVRPRLAAIRWCLLAATAMGALSVGRGDAMAQEPADKNKQVDILAISDELWLGVKCSGIDERLREQLKLDNEVKGIVVRDVIAKGPAAKAGLAVNDVLLSIDDVELGTPRDLAVSVEKSQGKELTLKLLRNGERQEVKVQPARRSETGGAPMSVRFVRPGHVVPAHVAIHMAQHDLPDDMTITIKKHAKEPAQITVEQGEKTWNVTGANVDELPQEILADLDPLLGRIRVSLPQGVGDVLTYIPDPEQVRAQIKAVEESIRAAGEAASNAAGAAADTAREEVRNAERRYRAAEKEWNLGLQSKDTIAERRALAAARAKQQAEVSSKWREVRDNLAAKERELEARKAALDEQQKAATSEPGSESAALRDEDKIAEIDRRLEELQAMVKSLRDSRRQEQEKKDTTENETPK